MSQKSSIIRELGRAFFRRVPWIRRHLFASTDYKMLTLEQARRRQANGWTSPRTIKRQDKAYNRHLQEIRDGEPRIDFQIVAEAVKHTGVARPAILEVGCGSGYYWQAFQYLLSQPFDYTGVDYSETMVKLASTRYPEGKFRVANACQLPFQDSSFDIVFDGVCLMHVLDFEQAIAESSRVAGKFCLYHSVPLFADRATTYLSKYAYGGPVVEVIFNRDELLKLFGKHGLDLVKSWKSIPYDVYPLTPQHSFCETFLLKVRDA